MKLIINIGRAIVSPFTRAACALRLLLFVFLLGIAQAARATGTDPVTTVTDQFTTLQGNAVTIGIAFLTLVGIVAVVMFGAKMLKRH